MTNSKLIRSPEEAIETIKANMPTSGYQMLREALDMAIEALKRECWIPVKERLPENAKHKGAFCPRYQVMTKYGVTEGWYNPDVEGRYVLIWFMTERVLTSEIDLKRGTYPKIVMAPIDTKIVTAWMPLPEPYRQEETHG